MKKLTIILILFTTIISCHQNNSNEKILYYSENNKLTLSKTIQFKNYDSLIYFYRNGKIFKHGKTQKDGKMFGIWKLYSNEGNLREIREWFVIDNISLINRVWFLDNKEDTIPWRYQDSIFKQKEFINDTIGQRNTDYNIFEFNKDTITLKDSFKGIAYCKTRRFGDYDSEIRVFFHSDSKDFDSPFPHDSLVRIETYKNLKYDSINQKLFKDIDPKYYGHIATFGCYFENPGKKLIKGYMEEYTYGPFKDKRIDSMLARVYFEKSIYVKDTIK